MKCCFSLGRKVSPSPLGRPHPILVRSPSLSSLAAPADPVFYGAPKSGGGMGNIGAYFRQSPGGVVVAQPAPLHLEDVNVFGGIAVLGENGKSPVAGEGWEVLPAKTTDSWQKTVEGMPEVYEMHVDSPAGYGRKIVTSPLNVVDNSNISIAKITREKMLKRQQEILKEAEERRRDQQLLLEQETRDEEEVEEEVKPASKPPTPLLTDDLGDDDEDDPLPIENDEAPPPPKPPTPVERKPPPPPKVSPVVVVPQQQLCKRIESARKGSGKPLSRSSSLKTPSSLRRLTAPNHQNGKTSQNMKYSLAASSLALFDESTDEAQTYPNPNEALKKALKSLATETWMGKIEGIRTIQRLAKSHPDILQMQLHPVVLALLTEVKNLRSSVARAAILAVGDLFVSLKRNVEPDLDLITSTLLSKCGETVGFIRDDIEKVMGHLIDTITPCKAALSIMAGGASHRNGAVRKVAAQSLLAVVEKMGAAKILTSAKDVTERLLPTTAQFLMDGMPLTRYYGRRIYHLLMQNPVFDKLLLRYVQPSTLRNINSILDSIRKKGPGDMPKEGVSARTLKNETYRNGHLSRTM